MKHLKGLVALGIVAAIAALAVAPAAFAGSSRDRATGGGQIAVSTSGGAGDTLAFTAQTTADTTDPANTATGQIQYVPHTSSNSAPSHGFVGCLVVDGNTAQLEGLFTSGPFAGDEYDLYVTDNSNGQSDPTNPDTLTFTPAEGNDSPPGGPFDCDGPFGTSYNLARGNVQVYDSTP
jgi:hypothetical protein